MCRPLTSCEKQEVHRTVTYDYMSKVLQTVPSVIFDDFCAKGSLISKIKSVKVIIKPNKSTVCVSFLLIGQIKPMGGNCNSRVGCSLKLKLLL